MDELECAKHEGEFVAYYFGNICIRAVRITNQTRVQLLPVSGDQAACGEWYDLTYEEVCQYCARLEQHLNKSEEE